MRLNISGLLLIAGFLAIFGCSIFLQPATTNAAFDPTSLDIFNEIPKDDTLNETNVTATVANRVLKILLFAGGILALLFMLIGSYSYITAGGDEAKVDKARKTIIWAVVGLLVVVASGGIFNLANNIITLDPSGAPQANL